MVLEWADAWNACDADRLVALLHPDFRIHRMRGDVIDSGGVREAVAKQTYGAAMKLFPRRLYGRGERFAIAGRVEPTEGDVLVDLGAGAPARCSAARSVWRSWRSWRGLRSAVNPLAPDSCPFAERSRGSGLTASLRRAMG